MVFKDGSFMEDALGCDEEMKVDGKPCRFARLD
jgi:hypothetical protein